MRSFIRKSLAVFAAGCAGGFINSLAVWLFGIAGISAAMGVSLAPALTPAWLYPRIVWGGIWGFLFLLPVERYGAWFKAFLYSLGPTLVQLLVVFPYKAGKGFFGLDLGLLTPLLVVFFNFVWGLAAVLLIEGSGRD